MSLSNEQIIEAIAGKTLMEVMELVKAMEEKFGVSAAAPVMMAAGPAAAAAPAEGAPQTVKDAVSKADADKFKKELEAAGAAVEVK
jgi:large subunit ribosomal protein L7/L12